MRGVNKVIIVGNLGADPESRQFNNGSSVTNISVATSEQWTDKQSGEKRESTEWHRISLFNRLGEIAAQYLRKGSKVYIEGSLRTRKYQDQSGQDRYVTEIRAEQMQMLDNVAQNSGGQYGNQQQGGQYGQQQQNNPPANQQQYGQQQGGQYGQQHNHSAPANSQQSFNNATTKNNPATNGAGPVDDDIPFFKHYDGE